VLKIYDPNEPVELETDASDYALGAQLSQRDEKGVLHPVAFYSYKLKGPETRYPIYDKEFMAIVNAFKEFRHYLQGSKHQVKVYTDHKNIAYFATTQRLNARQVRYAEELSPFDYVIIHRKGSENGRADALSRQPKDEEKTEDITRPLLQRDNAGNLKQMQLNLIFKVNFSTELEDKILASYPNEIPDYITERQETPLRYKGKTWLPEAVQKEAIWKFHTTASHGHPGAKKTAERLLRHFDAPGLRKRITEELRNCDICQKAKPVRHKPYGELQPLPVAERPWQTVAMDFITKLPESKEPMTKTKYDSILVVTDKLTKYGYFIPYKEASSSEDLAYIFYRHITSQHGIPEEIITDRGSVFASKFWQTLMALNGTNHKLSTAYHKTTNGQTERLNQTLEQYLRCYVNQPQDNWVTMLPVAQLAYNSAQTESTGISPAKANFGFNPTTLLPEKDNKGQYSEAAAVKASELTKLHEQLRKELSFVNEKMGKYYDKARSAAPTFERGDMVYLSRLNLKTTRPSDKLDFKRIGPFEVLEKISKNNYKLDLPPTMKLRTNNFHVSLLEPAHGQEEPTQEEIEVLPQEEEYEVEEILDAKTVNGEIRFLTKWKGYDDNENSWEPRENLVNCDDELKRFRQRLQKTLRASR
jgi:ribonuclease HI